MNGGAGAGSTLYRTLYITHLYYVSYKTNQKNLRFSLHISKKSSNFAGKIGSITN